MTSKRHRSAPVPADWINQLKKEGLGSKYKPAMREWAELLSPGTSRDEPDWDDAWTREIAADYALTLRKESPLYGPVATVFASAVVTLCLGFIGGPPKVTAETFQTTHGLPSGPLAIDI
jgi:hypothetical protein